MEPKNNPNNNNTKMEPENSISDSEVQTAYRAQRMTELSGVKNLYPHSFNRTCTLLNYRKHYDWLKNDEILSNVTEHVAGRIQTIRTASSKLYFAVIESDGVCLQVLANAKYYKDLESFNTDKKMLGKGDIIGVIGHPTRSAKGELSILPESIVILAPCLYLIPKDKSGFSDDGQRFRKRYLDFMIHPDRREIIKMRSQVNRFIRKYLDDLDFIEVETPIVSMKNGGANAKPFITYHNDFGKEMYLRIAPELYLKQLVIGGLEKIYEIGKQFRNESADHLHQPEFQSIEIYQAYADYTDMMKMVEHIIAGVVFSINGSHMLTYDSVDFSTGTSKKIEIDFMPPFARLDVITDLQKYGKFTFPEEILNNMDGENCRQFLINLCQERNIKCSDPKTIPRLLDKLIGEYLEPLCTNPTFIMNHPQIMSPLAKYHRDNRLLTERFELFINGREYANAYTELNDPVVQRACFEKQSKDKAMGDAEAQNKDEDFVEALEHGLPPTGGLGIGIDRLIMLLTNQSAIKEVLTFLP